jgi:hypothetical protein
MIKKYTYKEEKNIVITQILIPCKKKSTKNFFI